MVEARGVSTIVPENAVPGVDLIDLAKSRHPLECLASDFEGWKTIFEETRERVKRTIRNRDCIELLCKSTSYHLVETTSSKSIRNFASSFPLEQADVEILHALVLKYGNVESSIPTAPGRYPHIWEVVSKSLFAFSRMEGAREEEGPLGLALGRVKMHTVYYRNPLNREDCERVMRGILGRVDDVSLRELGYRLKDAFEMLLDLIKDTESRYAEFFKHFTTLGRPEGPECEIEDSIKFARDLTALSARLIDGINRKGWSIRERALAAFQVMDCAHSWIYELDSAALRERYGSTLFKFIDALTIPAGGLSSVNVDHIYMNNPVWAQPLLSLPDGRLLMPEPYLPISFSFRIFEPIIAKSAALKIAYEDARAKYLEDRIDEVIRLCLPNAQVYNSVRWTDPDSAAVYENDAVAFLGNHIFLFEAKSGRLDDAGRRGARKSFQEDLKQFFIEPGVQAHRLQQYLAEKKGDARLTLKDGTPIPLNMDRTKIVIKFSIAIEHFASLTSGKRAYIEMGLMSNEDAWAPVLSIGELEMLSRYLDTEISFFHYLTRRYTIEDLLYVSGDEQDFLSLYLTNGFVLDFEALKGVAVAFNDLDRVVRGQKQARSDRTEVESLGVPLSYHWKLFLQEIYRSSFPHKYDTIEILLNQSPANMFSLEQTLRKFRKGLYGGKKGDTLISHTPLGKRVFMFAMNLSKALPDSEDWVNMARKISYEQGRERVGATDCVTILTLKKARDGYDAITFHRYNDPKAGIREFVGGKSQLPMLFSQPPEIHHS